MRRALSLGGTYLFLALVMAALLLPFGLSLWDSLHQEVSPQEQGWTLHHYGQILERPLLLRALLNSLLVAVGCTALVVVSASLGAYALHRFAPPGTKAVLGGILSLKMFPLLLTLIPLFHLLWQAGLHNQLWGILLAQGAFILPFTFWLSWSYFKQIPVELFELAELEGGSAWSVLWRVAWPMVASGVGLVAFYSFVSSWNDYLVASVVNQSLRNSTLPFALVNLISSDQSEPRVVLALNSLLMLPPLLFYWFMQRHFRAASPTLVQ